MSSFLGELRRRNVFRVGVAYAVAGWLVLQVADLVFEAIEAPAWVMKALLFVIALGLPLALVFAWVFELTPQGIKRESEVDRSQSIARETGRKLNYTIITILALAVGLLAYDKFARSSGDAGGARTVAGAIGSKSIAVLPFVNMSDDPGNEYFSDGLSEELLNLLAKVDGLKVAARTSSFKFKGAKADIAEIGGALGVETVLEGSVRRSGDQVRITAQLINATDGFHLWSETYDRSLDNIFQVQDEIAGAIVDALKLPLLGATSAPVTTKATKTFAAYDLYLLGRHRARESNAASLRQAIDFFKGAIEADPEYAPAYSGLADAYLGLANYGDMALVEAVPAAEQAVNRALELDPGLAEAWASKGAVILDKDRAQESLPALRKAVEVNPNWAPAWMGLAAALSRLGRHQESMASSLRAVELDRMSDMFRQQHMIYLGAAGRATEARKLGLAWVAAEPDNAFPSEGLGEIHLRYLGQPQQAVVPFARAHALRPGDTYMARRMVEAFLTMNDLPSAKRWLEEARKRGPRTTHTQFAAYNVALVEGDADAQLALVRQYLDENPNSTVALSGLAQVQIRSGQLDAAEATLRRLLELQGDQPDGPLLANSAAAGMSLASIYEQRGDKESLARWLGRLSALRDTIRADTPTAMDADLLSARLASLRGEREAMLGELGTAVRHGFRSHWSLRADPAFIKWRDDPKFQSFVAELERQNTALRAELVASKEGQALVAAR